MINHHVKAGKCESLSQECPLCIYVYWAWISPSHH